MPRKKAYKYTEVPYEKSQRVINDLLAKYKIFNVQHTIGFAPTKLKYAIAIFFEYPEGEHNVPIRLLIPLDNTPGSTTKEYKTYRLELNQVYRALFYYLKTKFESLEFGFEFLNEFMPYIVVRGSEGQISTVGENFLPQYLKALETGSQGSIPLLPEIIPPTDKE